MDICYTVSQSQSRKWEEGKRGEQKKRREGHRRWRDDWNRMAEERGRSEGWDERRRRTRQIGKESRSKHWRGGRATSHNTPACVMGWSVGYGKGTSWGWIYGGYCIWWKLTEPTSLIHWQRQPLFKKRKDSEIGRSLRDERQLSKCPFTFTKKSLLNEAEMKPFLGFELLCLSISSHRQTELESVRKKIVSWLLNHSQVKSDWVLKWSNCPLNFRKKFASNPNRLTLLYFAWRTFMALFLF